MARGIIGNKPTTTGLTAYSDVFGPDTQFSAKSTNTWPSATYSNEDPAFVGFTSTYSSGSLFDSFRKLSNGFYCPEHPYDMLPPSSSFSTFWSGGPGIFYHSAAACSKYVAFTGDNGNYTFLYKRVASENFVNSSWQYIGSLLGTATNLGKVYKMAFNRSGTYLATISNKVSGANWFRVFSIDQNSNAFTDIGIADPYVASNGTVPPTGNVSWNKDGTSLAIGAGNKIIIYNVSGSVFTGGYTILTHPAGTYSKTDWNHDGSSLAVMYGDSNTGYTSTLVVYDRSGDSFSPVFTASIPGQVTQLYNGYNMSWNNNGTLLAVGLNPSFAAGTTFSSAWGGFAVYSRSGSTFTKLTTPLIIGALSSDTSAYPYAQSIQFSRDGSQLFVAVQGTTSIKRTTLEIFDVRGTNITRPTTWPMVNYKSTVGSGSSSTTYDTGTMGGTAYSFAGGAQYLGGNHNFLPLIVI